MRCSRCCCHFPPHLSLGPCLYHSQLIQPFYHHTVTPSRPAASSAHSIHTTHDKVAAHALPSRFPVGALAQLLQSCRILLTPHPTPSSHRHPPSPLSFRPLVLPHALFESSRSASRWRCRAAVLWRPRLLDGARWLRWSMCLHSTSHPPRRLPVSASARRPSCRRSCRRRHSAATAM